MIDDATRAELRAKYPGAISLSTEEGLFVLRRPTPAEYARFKAAAIDDKQKPRAVEQLVGLCVVYPAREVYAAACERKPALPDMLGEPLLALAGAGMRVEVEQL